MNVFTLPDPRPLEKSIARKLDIKKTPSGEWRQFTNGEWFLRILRTSKNAIVLGRTEPSGDHILQTLTLIDTLKRNGAKTITVVLPYFGYCRQDRIVRTGDHLPADLLVKTTAQLGASRILTIDLHSSITEKNSSIPLVGIDFVPELTRALKKYMEKKELCTIISPDKGSKKRAETLRDLFDPSAPVCWFEKHRDPMTGRVHAHDLNGTPRGTTAIITDDICDTGGTIREAVRGLKKQGFKKLFLCITHPVFSAHATPLLRSLKFTRIFVSNTIPLASSIQKKLPLTIVDAAPTLTIALKKITSV